jgi:catalase
MPKNSKAPPAPSKAAPKAAARNTDSGPASVAADSNDLAARRMAEVDTFSAAMDNHENKVAEHGFANGVQPPHGATVEPPSRLPGGSTLSEANSSDKVGTEALDGLNATTDTLDRVRVDSSGRALTTNQGVAIADNQNSLKYGVRGPVLLEDFILREKITHFDHERIPERIVHARGSGAHGFF